MVHNLGCTALAYELVWGYWVQSILGGPGRTYKIDSKSATKAVWLCLRSQKRVASVVFVEIGIYIGWLCDTIDSVCLLSFRKMHHPRINAYFLLLVDMS